MPKPPYLWLLFKLHLLEYIRDPLAAGFSFALPLLFLVSFGVTSSIAESRVAEVALVSAAGDAGIFENVLSEEPGLRIVKTTREEAMRKLTSKEVSAVVVVASPPIVYVRGEQERFGDIMARRLELGAYRASAGNGNAFKAQVQLLPGDAKRTAFDFIAPGIFALALLQLGLFGTGNQILIARQAGTLQRLRTTPVSDRDIIGAHILVRLLVAICQIVFLALAAHFAFGLKFLGGIGPFALASLTGGIVLSLIGYAIGGVAPTAQSGSMMIMLMNFFMMFAGQVFFDLRGNLSGKIATFVNPVSPVADSFRYAVSGEAQALSFVQNQLLILGWCVVLFAITLKYFKYNMENA